MSRKTARSQQQAPPDAARVRRLLEKGDAREAVKEAKRCLRIDAGSANQQLLQEALLGRVEQLHRLKQIVEARAVLGELDRLKPAAQHITERLTRLRVLLGDGSATAQAALQADPKLLTEMVDKAVLDERCIVPDDASIRSQVTAVRESLVAVERGEDDAAAELLAGISRTSPLADWRLFVRGLSAFYQQDEERTRKNWDRLDSARPAHVIATTLRTAAESDPNARAQAIETFPGMADRLKRVERQRQAGSPVAILVEMVAAWRRQRWPTLAARLKSLQRRVGDSDPAMVRQVVEITWKQAVREHKPGLLHQLQFGVPEPDLDPRWNRARALMYEHPDSPTLLSDGETAWLRYAGDLQELTILSDQERQIATGLVYQRLARMLRRASECAGEPPAFAYYAFIDDEEERQREQKEHADAAIRYYRKSVEACPLLKESFQELVALHEELDQPKKAAAVMKELAKADPNCFEAAIWLASHYLSEDQPAESEKYIAVARRLRPRDRLCEVLSWNQKIASVRCFTIKRKFAEARDALEAAALNAPEDAGPLMLDLVRAAIEFKAKNADAAMQFVDSALAKVSDPLPVWMQMGAIAGRMRVAREFKKTFDDRFKNDINGTPTSEAAGMMSEIMASLKRSHVNYTGRATHERLLLTYLSRATSIDWQEGHLRSTCRFLALVPRWTWLRDVFVELGMKRFARVADFHFWYGTAEFNEGPFWCDHGVVQRAFETALELHDSGESRLGEKDYETARASLSTVKEYLERNYGSPFGNRYFDDDEDDDEDDDDAFGLIDDECDDEYDDEDSAFAAGSPAHHLGGGLDLQQVFDSLPPELKKKVERTCQEYGISFAEMVQKSADMAAEDSSPP